MINQHQSLSELYDAMLRKKRDHERLLESGNAKCLHCSQQKSVHLYDGRCSISALSREFHYDDMIQMRMVERAISLIEELTSL